MFTLTTKDRHGVLLGKRIRRLTPRECLRLQGWRDEQIDRVLAISPITRYTSRRATASQSRWWRPSAGGWPLF